jgi:hypothetical protein
MRRWLALGLAIGLLAACGGDPEPTESAPGNADWGPLAVAVGGNGDRARNEGRLEITDSCVFLVHRDNHRTLLIWPVAQTHWDPSGQTILFNRGNGVGLRLFHGQAVEVGGSGDALGNAGPPAELLDHVPWVAAPMPECGAPDYWRMGDIGPLREGP